MSGRILIHLPRHMLAEIGDGRPHFYNRALAALRDAGAEAAQVARAPGNPAPDPGDGDFHLIHQGTHAQPNVLNTGMAYIAPFWYADPKGIYGESSLTGARFDPAAIPAAPARAFLRRTRARLVVPRRSRYEQKAEVTDFPEGVIAVFLQGASDFSRRAGFLSAREMVEGVLAAAGGRPVVVKPHPLGTEAALMDRLRTEAERGRLLLTDANVHDILARAAVTVSIASAVALEGMIHGVPAVLCGRSDLHHCAQTVRRPDEIGAAIEMATARDWPFARFLSWFLLENMLNTGAPDFAARLIARIAARLPDPGAFGLAG